jgi:hypothetical protein
MIDWLAPDLSAEDERIVADFMTTLGHAPIAPQPRLADADVVWIKAQLLRRWDVERNVRAPLELVEPLQLIAGLAASALLLFWSLPSLLRLLAPLTL